MTKKTPSCDHCGETDPKPQTVRLTVNNKTRARWLLCRGCTAVKYVALVSDKGDGGVVKVHTKAVL